MVKWLHGYMAKCLPRESGVKFVRLPFYEQSDMKRLSRTNPRFIGMPVPRPRWPAPGIGGYFARRSFSEGGNG
jgi:hypothetical protein